MAADVVPFGLLELDAAGKVRFYKPAQGLDARLTAANLVGSDFFSAILPCAEVHQFRPRFITFMASGEWVERTTVSVQLEQKAIQVQFVMVCLSGQSAGATQRMALVRVRPALLPTGSKRRSISLRDKDAKT